MNSMILQTVITVAAFLVWSWTIVWGASALKIELTHVREDLNALTRAFQQGSETVSTILSDHGERISRIEGKIGGH